MASLATSVAIETETHVLGVVSGVANVMIRQAALITIVAFAAVARGSRQVAKIAEVSMATYAPNSPCVTILEVVILDAAMLADYP